MPHAFIPDLEQGGQVNLHQGGANVPVPLHQLLGELVDDAFDLGELGSFELLVARFDG